MKTGSMFDAYREPDLPNEDPDVVAGMEQLVELRAGEARISEFSARRRYS